MVEPKRATTAVTAETREMSRNELTPVSEGETQDAQPTASLIEPAAPSETIDPRDTLRREEMGRMQVYASLVIVLCVLALCLMPLLGGPRLGQFLLLGAMGTAVAVASFLLWLTRALPRFRRLPVAASMHVLSLASHVASLYFGVFSPFAGMQVLTLYVFALGNSFRSALFAYVNLALGQGVLVVLTTTGKIPDIGLIRADNLELSQALAVHTALQCLYFVTLLLARIGRQRTIQAIIERDTAVQEIARRQALLYEAKLALAHAEQGGPGRYTDQTVGSFRLGDIIGRGSAGEIYEAKHQVTGDQAAVKLLHSGSLSQPTQLTRFGREARVAASLSSPHLVRVIEVADEESPVPYLAMERLFGQDLSHILRERMTLSAKEVITMVEQVSAGLEVAHAAGIVHRDIKPQNIFYAESRGDRMWKILDFGVSKQGDGQSSLTVGYVIGTPAYMAPEQAKGQAVDHRADLYSLGVIIYRCLTGRPAFSGPQIPQLLYEVVHTMPMQPSHAADLSEDMDAFLAVAMAKDRSDRFANGDELCQMLRAAVARRLPASVRERASAILARRPWS